MFPNKRASLNINEGFWSVLLHNLIVIHQITVNFTLNYKWTTLLFYISPSDKQANLKHKNTFHDKNDLIHASCVCLWMSVGVLKQCFLMMLVVPWWRLCLKHHNYRMDCSLSGWLLHVHQMTNRNNSLVNQSSVFRRMNSIYGHAQRQQIPSDSYKNQRVKDEFSHARERTEFMLN